ncbi:MAG: hypothetical protein H6751_07525 [Candidatus Omnitrophica bacterium]|nr:hypothetical protein [Candidatus Omnitrophota bacterium]
MSGVDFETLNTVEAGLSPQTLARIEEAANRIIEAKKAGKKVAVVTGSGPNLHEGVTTLIAELIRVGVIDGVTTSSAVIAHEMAGTLDRVKRVDGVALGFPAEKLPRGGCYELTLLDEETLEEISGEMPLDQDLLDRLEAAEGEVIIKAAGNMAYPMGLRTERLAVELLQVAKIQGVSLEAAAGQCADPRTMIGAGARKGVPVLVSIPQLVGGGGVGLAIGDSLSITARAAAVSRIMGDAEVIIESAVALTQEIHDGPFETYTGHGIWADWMGQPTYSLEDKSLIRIDLDPNLEKVCEIERGSSQVQEAINKGLPKTKLLNVPFRMEMSGFARLPKSLPITGDIGSVWPLMARKVCESLGIELGFISYPQQTGAGQRMREWIADQVRPYSKRTLKETCQTG